MSTLAVLLVTSTDRSFAGHKITATFTQTVSQRKSRVNPPAVPGETTSFLNEHGEATLNFPARELVAQDAPISLRVISPDGEVLHQESVSAERLDQAEPLKLSVDPKVYFPIEANTDPAYLSPSRIRGLVVDTSGSNRVGGRQIVIWGQPKDTAGAQASFELLATARSDSRGYFSVPYPVGVFAAAAGTIDGSVRIPINLDAKGQFPERIALGSDALPSTDEKDEHNCACATDVPRAPDAEDFANSSAFSGDVGRCVDMTIPNRVLEEFDFYTVVRTTEPSIKGLTVKEPPKIALDDVLELLDPKLFRMSVVKQGATDGGTVALRSLRFTNGPDEAISISTRETESNGFALAAQPELSHLADVIGLTAAKLNSQDRDVAAASDLPQSKDIRLDAEIVRTLTQDPDGFSLTRLAQAELVTRKNDLLRVLEVLRRVMPARGTLNCTNPVDWDDEPTFFQACTIAHGHILHLKQEWVADGYSMGDLLYSLPLAPGQKKQVAVIDWDRREAAARRESLDEQEHLSAQLSRDRDVSEIANAMVRENMSGGSEAGTSSFGGGLGIGAILGPVGGLLGIGGGTSGSSASSWQNASRSTSASSLQQLRDRVSQAASAVRSQRSTVVQTLQQGETMRVQTDVVANHNHCHAVTIEYFEVLRHFLVRNRLADVQECLLVPLLMTRFDSNKARRWREPLLRYLRQRPLARGFDALQRIADNYVGSDMPTGSYAEDQLTYLDGWLRLQFRIQRPRDNSDGSFLEASWNVLSWLGISPNEFWGSYLKDQQQRDRIFAEILGPRIAEEISNGLRIYAVDENDTQTQLPIDATLVSDFQNDQPLYISLRVRSNLPPLRRDRIKFIRIDTTIDTKSGARNIDTLLPTGSKVVVSSGQMGYRTAHIAHDLFNQGRILNDLSGTDGVVIFCPLSRQELRRPREEDKEIANRLLRHLNDQMEHYHRAIWWSMDAQRRFMLLDGFIAPNSGGRSVASVVENRLVGIMGNCLVMPVARGFHLDPTYGQNEDQPIDLLDHYQPTTPIAPHRVAVPTKGVFAEAVMGSCNACEKKDESRFWRWEESPSPDEPTSIAPISTESRRAEPPVLTAKDFPAPIVAFQNVPAAPDPQGFGGLLQLLSNPNLFRDMAGLTETQRNALAGLQAALGTAQFFGGKAADLALQANMNRDIDKALDKIDQQHRSGAINDQQRAQLTESALRSMIGGGTQTPAQPLSPEQVRALTETAGANDASVQINRPGEQLQVDARPNNSELADNTRTVIVLPANRNAPEARAFQPSSNNKTGIIEVEAQVRNAPAGATYRWTRPDTSALTIDNPTSLRSRVRGLHPGRTQLDFAVSDGSGTALASVQLQLCVPQFVTIDEEAAALDATLATFRVDHVKADVLRVAKTVCDQLLRTANVRTIWRLAPFNETAPAHLTAAELTTLTLRGDPPTPGLAGITRPVGGGIGAATFNEVIDIYPGAYDDAGGTTEVDVETQALVIQLESMTATDPALEQFAIQVFGRLIGETMAHEIIHSLVAFDIPTGHNTPAIPNDLMNHGIDRNFRQRTGFEDTSHTSPVDPTNFVDHGLTAIGGLTATTQALVDARFPVPPAFS